MTKLNGATDAYRFPSVPLAEIVSPVSRTVDVIPGQSYRTIGVKWWGEGAYERATIDGSQTAAKTLSLVREGDLIINKIWVRHGSTAIASTAVDGCAASGEFPTFELDRKRVLPAWIHWQTKTHDFWNKCDALSQGTSGKNRIRPDLFLTITIPLPPLAEQRRIVARIEDLAAKIAEARGLRREAVDAMDFLFIGAMKNVRDTLLADNHQHDRLGDVTRVTSGGTPSRDNASYWGGEIPWIKTGELLDGEINQAEESITAMGLANSGAKLLPPDTILVALYGQGQTRGRTGRLAIEAATNQACAAVLPCPQLDPVFTQYWLRSLYYKMREQVRNGAQPNWNGQMIKSIGLTQAAS